MNGRTYLAAATSVGVYLAFRENPSVFTRVLQLPKITMMASLPRYDRLVLLANGTLISYSLQALVTVAQSRAPPSELDKTLIKLAPKHNGQVHFFRLGKIAGKDLRESLTIFFSGGTLTYIVKWHMIRDPLVRRPYTQWRCD